VQLAVLVAVVPLVEEVVVLLALLKHQPQI
jgi:hypothetical protein